MLFAIHNCPECGSRAVGTAEKVIARFKEPDGDNPGSEEFEYSGDTDLDGQETITNAASEVLLVCECGNEWYSVKLSD